MEDIKVDAQSTEERYLKGDLEAFVLENVENCKMFNGNIDWAKMVYLAENEFDDEFTKEKIRSIYRKHTEPNFTNGNSARARKSESRREGKITLREQIVKRLKNKTTIDFLFDTISFTEKDILSEISRMELDGYMIDKWNENGIGFLKLTKEKHLNNSKEIDLSTTKNFSIAVVGDTHFGHSQSRVEEFKAFIKYAYDKGIRDVIHTGDWLEGHYMSIRPTSIKELVAIGFDDQLEYANSVVPKLEGLHYYGISGNHDATFDRQSFANPVKLLSRLRDDISYLGHNFGRITLNSKVDIAIVHPNDKGVSQNYGLKIHQYIDKAEQDKQARVVLMGHYHKHTHVHYKGIDGFITPSFIGQSNFMKDNNMPSVVGGMILHFAFNDEDELISLTPEYVWFK